MEYTPRQLREMDDDEARETLTVDQYERREELLDLLDDAEDARDELNEQEQRVEDLVVHADPESLGTEVDVFGNTLLVHVDSENGAFRDAADDLETIQDDTPDDESATIDPERIGDAADALTTMLDCAIVRWNGHDWAGLTDQRRQAILDDAREKWGADGLLLAWLDIAAAVGEQRQERVDVIEKFRDPSRRGNR
jgi:hypothetical protein